MLKKIIFAFLLIHLSQNLWANKSFQERVPIIEAKSETDPIPAGFDETDDPAIWVHPKDSKKSLILGTSKYDDDPSLPGGLGVYDLSGKELAFFPVGKLNNVDLITSYHKGTAYAFASNRDRDAISIFFITSSGKVSYLGDSPVLGPDGKNKEPYGLCTSKTSHKREVFVTFKDGTLHRYRMNISDPLNLAFKETIDLKSYVTEEQDAVIIKNIIYELTADDELDENLAERFILEGCVFDESYDRLFVGMEKLGVWTIENGAASSSSIRLLWKITASYTTYQTNKGNGYHLTDDVEGISIYKQDFLRGTIIVSSQGIDEYILFDRFSLAYKGSFKVSFGLDPITHTDGLAVSSSIRTEEYPAGLLVVHDDENGPVDGPLEHANFKLISWLDVMESLGEYSP